MYYDRIEIYSPGGTMFRTPESCERVLSSIFCAKIPYYGAISDTSITFYPVKTHFYPPKKRNIPN